MEGCIKSLTANLREPKSFYLSPPESTKGLRMGARRTARFNQPATRLASNPDLQICKHCIALHDSYRTILMSGAEHVGLGTVHGEVTAMHSKAHR